MTITIKIERGYYRGCVRRRQTFQRRSLTDLRFFESISFALHSSRVFMFRLRADLQHLFWVWQQARVDRSIQMAV